MNSKKQHKQKGKKKSSFTITTLFNYDFYSNRFMKLFCYSLFVQIFFLPSCHWFPLVLLWYLVLCVMICIQFCQKEEQMVLVFLSRVMRFISCPLISPPDLVNLDQPSILNPMTICSRQLIFPINIFPPFFCYIFPHTALILLVR